MREPKDVAGLMNKSPAKQTKKININFGPTRVDQFDRLFEKIKAETKMKARKDSITGSDVNIEFSTKAPEQSIGKTKSKTRLSVGYISLTSVGRNSEALC